jgi:DNA-binding MarR family transcriptional regulator
MGLARRLLLSAALGVSLLAAAVGAAGALDERADVPQEAAIPSALLGDHGEYRLALGPAWDPSPLGGDDAIGATALRFALAPGGDVRMADGLLHATDRVEVSGPVHHPTYGWLDRSGAVLLERGGTEALAYDWRYNGTEVFDGGLLGDPNVPSPIAPLGTRVLVHSDGLMRRFGDTGPACLVANAAQGRSLRPGDAVALPSCLVAGALALGGPYTAVGFEEVAGVRALRLESDAPIAQPVPGEGSAIPANVTLWMAGGIAPIVQARAAIDGDGRTLVLAAFGPGAAERGPPVAPHDPTDGLVMAPMQPWGPDDSGADIALAPSLAWKQATGDPTVGLSPYLASHPDAYVAGALLLPYRDNPGWWFDVVDPPSGTGYSVYVVAVAFPAGLPAPFPQQTFAYFDRGVFEFDEPMPLKEALPPVPTLASAAAQWRAHADGPHPLNSAFYGIGCASAVRGCEATALTYVGWAQVNQSQPRPAANGTSPMLLEERASAIDWLASVDGVDQDLIQSRNEETTMSGLDAPAPPPAKTAAAASSSPGLVAAWMPTPAEAAGVGAAGLLATLVVWLWPALRGGAAALFSRVQPARLPESPPRAQILALLAAEPGLHFHGLARRSGLSNGALVHHLRKLEEGGLVRAQRTGRYTCYVVADAAPAVLRAAPAVCSPGARAVLAAAMANPGSSLRDLAGRCGLRASTVAHHVRRLAEGGLLEVRRDGRSKRLHPSPLASSFVSTDL